MEASILMARQQGFEGNPFASRSFLPRRSPTFFGGHTEYLPYSHQAFEPQLMRSRFDLFSNFQSQQFRPDERQLPPALAFAEALHLFGTSEPLRLSRKLGQRIMELSALKRGWDGIAAEAPKPEAIAHAVGLILILQSAFPEFEEPFVVPTIDGFTQLEWHRGQRALEFEATASGWSVVGSETKPSGARAYYATDTARFDVDKLLAAYRWFAGLELWPII